MEKGLVWSFLLVFVVVGFAWDFLVLIIIKSVWDMYCSQLKYWVCCKDCAFCMSKSCLYYGIEWTSCCCTFWWSVTSWVGLLFLAPVAWVSTRTVTPLRPYVIKKTACAFTCKY